jgi:hypothetical protein
MAELERDQVLYLYGVVRGGQRIPAAGATALKAVPFSSLVAVVERVPASELEPEALEQKLQCLEWVAPLARRHAAVLEEVMRHGPVVPARICTLFSSADALAGALAENARRFEDALRRLDGRQEWGLKLFCDEERLRAAIGSSDPRARALDAAARAASEGQAYVLRKQRDGHVAAVAADRIEEVTGEVLDALAADADARLRAPLAAAATGRREAMVLNAALLVDQASVAALHAAADELASRLRDEGFALELTGPWPPYSFCDDSDDDGDPDSDPDAAPREAP